MELCTCLHIQFENIFLTPQNPHVLPPIPQLSNHSAFCLHRLLVTYVHLQFICVVYASPLILFVHPFFSWGAFGLFPVWNYYEWCCSMYSFDVGVFSFLLGMELLGHEVTQYLSFPEWLPFSIPTISVRGFQLLHVATSASHCLCVYSRRESHEFLTL